LTIDKWADTHTDGSSPGEVAYSAMVFLCFSML
jgi:hypothetical protein